MANSIEKILYLDKTAAHCGNGAKDTPFSCLPCAFLAAKKLLREAKEPTHVILDIADGDYSLSETLTLRGSDMPIPGSHLTLRGHGNAVISSLKDIPADAFSAEKAQNRGSVLFAFFHFTPPTAHTVPWTPWTRPRRAPRRSPPWSRSAPPR